MNQSRVAWVMPICCVYWQVILKDFVKRFPRTKIFTSKIFLNSWELEKKFSIETVGKLKTINIKSNQNGYGSKFSYMSPLIIIKLLRYQPHIIFADTFCLWTLLILLFKPWGKWKVILSYEGSSPGVDYCYSSSRLFVRRLMVKMADAYITNTQAGKVYFSKILNADESKVFNYPYLVPDSQLLVKKSLLVKQPCPLEKEPLKTIYRQKIQEELVAESSSSNIQFKQTAFLFIGRLIPRKGITSLLNACVILNKQQYENYSLLIIGEGEQEAELKQFCCLNNLNDRVIWIGKVDYESIGTYFEQADVLVLPSLEDTWGMVVLEAILFGKVVLCSTHAGAAEIVAENSNGFVFEPQNSDKLAQLMKTLIDDPQLIKLMQQKSRQIAATYTPELSAKFFDKIANFVVDQSPKDN